MGLKKYEIITVGSDKRVRALRSWAVGGRYVNIGDVGGIVYDEKTLSQDGACWLFRGNFGFPGARIGGDSIVDVGETTLGATGAPNVDILGSSVVVCGSKLRLESDQTAADAVVLKADDFEQGTISYAKGVNWETWKAPSARSVRLKAPIFLGGVATTLSLSVPGYSVQAYVLDRDGLGITVTNAVETGAGVTLAVPAGQYFMLRLAKNPAADIVPADATAAQIAFTGTYEAKLSIIDSRLEINPANSTNTVFVKAGGSYTMAPGVKYPEYIIRNSKVSINVPTATNRSVRLMGQIIESTALLDCTTENLTLAGTYRNVNNLTASGVLTTNVGTEYYSGIQAINCNYFAVSPTIFPGLAAAITANMPFIFQGCNVPNGIFYHHSQIANTYKNIDFAEASAYLGKTFSTNRFLGSSEVNGMYRTILNGTPGPLIENYESVKDMVVTQNQNMYNTTIYADAYFNGSFDIQGTNVFGHKVRSHPLAQVLNVQPRAVQGSINTSTVGGTITGVVTSGTRVVVPTPLRVNGSTGLRVDNIPTGIEAMFVYVNPVNVVTANSAWTASSLIVGSAQLKEVAAYLVFRKADNTSLITPEELAGVTVTVYNGCKIVNTGETDIPMKGNIRVEDNATLVNTSVTGSGYFGGNCAMSGAIINGCVYMKDNAKFVKTVGLGAIRNLKMSENAYAVLGDFALNGRIHLSDNARFTPTAAGLSEGDLVMKDNAVVSGAVTVGGVVTMKDNAKVSAGTLSAYGDITICGSYNQTASKTWAGKRTIADSNAPEYDNNVKTQYDF